MTSTRRLPTALGVRSSTRPADLPLPQTWGLRAPLNYPIILAALTQLIHWPRPIRFHG